MRATTGLAWSQFLTIAGSLLPNMAAAVSNVFSVLLFRRPAETLQYESRARMARPQNVAQSQWNRLLFHHSHNLPLRKQNGSRTRFRNPPIFWAWIISVSTDSFSVESCARVAHCGGSFSCRRANCCDCLRADADRGSSGDTKGHASRLREAVVLPQVPVRFHAQGAAVFVPEPAGDGRDVYAAFDANRRKQVT